MRKRKTTIGYGPNVEARGYVKLALEFYATLSNPFDSDPAPNPATLVITTHAAESVGNAGFQSALAIMRDPKLPFEHQVGEMFGMLGAFLRVVYSANEEFVGLMLVNHLPRETISAAAQKEEFDTLAEGVEKFCNLAFESLKNTEQRQIDWVYLDCEALD